MTKWDDWVGARVAATLKHMCEDCFSKLLLARRRLGPFERVDPIRFAVELIFMVALEGGAQALSSNELGPGEIWCYEQ